jgi:hypothetical protein
VHVGIKVLDIVGIHLRLLVPWLFLIELLLVLFIFVIACVLEVPCTLVGKRLLVAHHILLPWRWAVRHGIMPPIAPYPWHTVLCAKGNYAQCITGYFFQKKKTFFKPRT